MNLFKKILKKKIKKTFAYSLRVNDEVINYEYVFEVNKKASKNEMIKICYDEFVNKHSVNMIDNIVNVSIR